MVLSCKDLLVKQRLLTIATICAAVAICAALAVNAYADAPPSYPVGTTLYAVPPTSSFTTAQKNAINQATNTVLDIGDKIAREEKLLTPGGLTQAGVEAVCNFAGNSGITPIKAVGANKSACELVSNTMGAALACPAAETMVALALCLQSLKGMTAPAKELVCKTNFIPACSEQSEADMAKGENASQYVECLGENDKGSYNDDPGIVAACKQKFAPDCSFLASSEDVPGCPGYSPQQASDDKAAQKASQECTYDANCSACQGADGTPNNAKGISSDGSDGPGASCYCANDKSIIIKPGEPIQCNAQNKSTDGNGIETLTKADWKAMSDTQKQADSLISGDTSTNTTLPGSSSTSGDSGYQSLFQ